MEKEKVTEREGRWREGERWCVCVDLRAGGGGGGGSEKKRVVVLIP